MIIGDVHGMARELRVRTCLSNVRAERKDSWCISARTQALVRRAKLRPSCDSLFFTGDLIGIGPSSIEAVREVRSLLLSGLDVESVLGNHEAGFLRWLDQRPSAPPNAEYEQWATSFGSDELLWLRERPLHAALPPAFGRFRIVHAGMQPAVPLGEQRRDIMLTIRRFRSKAQTRATSLFSRCVVLLGRKAQTRRLACSLQLASCQMVDQAATWSILTCLVLTLCSLLPNGTGSARPGKGHSWAAAWGGPEHLIFGHDARRKLQRYAHATGIDSACVQASNDSAHSHDVDRTILIGLSSTGACMAAG